MEGRGNPPFFMKRILALLFFLPSFSFAVESIPAYQNEVYKGQIGGFNSPSYLGGPIITVPDAVSILVSQCLSSGYLKCSSDGKLIPVSHPLYRIKIIFYHSSNPSNPIDRLVNFSISSTLSGAYSCPPPNQPSFAIGPVVLNGSHVCQKPPKTCLKGAIVRVTSDGKETCVPNCGAAAGLAHSGPYFYQAGPNSGSTAGEIKCYGQCSIQTIGGGVQLSSGTWTGSFTFTGANCSVVRPEPTFDSENDTSSNGNSPPVDNSNTSEGTDNALNELEGAASGATGTQVQPNATGPNGETTLKDIAKVVADAANAQIKATSEQNVATGNLVSNISKDIQNAVHNAGHGGGGASASLQAQGNTKLDGITDKLSEISDKLDNEKEEDNITFNQPAKASPFWEKVLPESSFASIKKMKEDSIQELKDLRGDFSSGMFPVNLSVSGERPEFSITHGNTTFVGGSFVFDTLSNSGLGAIIILIATLAAIYIITTRGK